MPPVSHPTPATVWRCDRSDKRHIEIQAITFHDELMDLDFDALRAFLAIVDTGGFARAARVLRRSQSAVR